MNHGSCVDPGLGRFPLTGCVLDHCCIRCRHGSPPDYESLDGSHASVPGCRSHGAIRLRTIANVRNGAGLSIHGFHERICGPPDSAATPRVAISVRPPYSVVMECGCGYPY